MRTSGHTLKQLCRHSLTSTRAQLSMCGKHHSHAEPETFKQSRCCTPEPAPSVTVLNRSPVPRPISTSASSAQTRSPSDSCVPSPSSAAGWKRLTATSAEQRTNLGEHQNRRRPDKHTRTQQSISQQRPKHREGCSSHTPTQPQPTEGQNVHGAGLSHRITTLLQGKLPIGSQFRSGDKPLKIIRVICLRKKNCSPTRDERGKISAWVSFVFTTGNHS